MPQIKAAVCREFGAPLTIETVTLAAPNMGEVEVTLKACAICHSDISYMDGAWGAHCPPFMGMRPLGMLAPLAMVCAV
uniref:alcohol dehydrogenase catalytic domain-containing protein n=1 Tax=Yoonia sp. GPGPB17 TaxID=3026147 RepID=UPI0030EF4372